MLICLQPEEKQQGHRGASRCQRHQTFLPRHRDDRHSVKCSGAK
jgi:hypothetical protein